jgi:hypothetical protein
MDHVTNAQGAGTDSDPTTDPTAPGPLDQVSVNALNAHAGIHCTQAQFYCDLINPPGAWDPDLCRLILLHLGRVEELNAACENIRNSLLNANLGYNPPPCGSGCPNLSQSCCEL